MTAHPRTLKRYCTVLYTDHQVMNRSDAEIAIGNFLAFDIDRVFRNRVQEATDP